MTMKRHVYALLLLLVVLGGAFAVMRFSGAPSFYSGRMASQVRTPIVYKPMASNPPCTFTIPKNPLKVSGGFSMAVGDVVRLRRSKSVMKLTSFTLTATGTLVTAVTANLCVKTGSRFTKHTITLGKTATIGKVMKVTVTGGIRTMMPAVPSLVIFKAVRA